ncbi:MAG: hypothetical protein AVDCRST_MAG39-1688, partial [uncultured Sphingomonadaceae bacterium]
DQGRRPPCGGRLRRGGRRPGDRLSADQPAFRLGGALAGPVLGRDRARFRDRGVRRRERTAGEV